MSESARIDMIMARLKTGREYTNSLLESIDDADWFWQPDKGITHIAWQVGHLAMAQYGLVLFRQRGRQPIDTELMSSKFRKRFAKGTTPESDPSHYPGVEEIRDVFQRVYEQSMQELPTFSESSLDDPVDPPYSGLPTKFGALLFATDHEMLHAGQIGLLRRLMGKEPVR